MSVGFVQKGYLLVGMFLNESSSSSHLHPSFLPLPSFHLSIFHSSFQSINPIPYSNYFSFLSFPFLSLLNKHNNEPPPPNASLPNPIITITSHLISSHLISSFLYSFIPYHTIHSPRTIPIHIYTIHPPIPPSTHPSIHPSIHPASQPQAPKDRTNEQNTHTQHALKKKEKVVELPS